MTISVCIPTFRPDGGINNLIDKLHAQTVMPIEIILCNTIAPASSKLVPEDYTSDVSVINISQSEFDHAATRQMLFEKAKGDIVVFMTQDAIPLNNRLLEQLTVRLSTDEKIACAYARQLPRANATPEERVGRRFNYPEDSCLKSAPDIERMGIKTFFCSDVCAAYRRDAFMKLGGFVKRSIFNEDLLFAAKAVKNGYTVAYEAKAEVIHSHSYSSVKQFRRNFDNGVSQAMYADIIGGVRSESEGKRLVKATFSALKDEGKLMRVPGFVFGCGARYAGFKLGKKYKSLPKWLILKCTDNKIFWENMKN